MSSYDNLKLAVDNYSYEISIYDTTGRYSGFYEDVMRNHILCAFIDNDIKYMKLTNDAIKWLEAFRGISESIRNEREQDAKLPLPSEHMDQDKYI